MRTSPPLRQMLLDDALGALFSFKSLVAAFVAVYVAASIGLPRPYWALVSSYLVSQPLSGAVLSKSLFRVMGTLLGAAAAVALVPNLANEPLVLSAALAIWSGLCVYLALLDRTPRSYVFLLAGYTAAIIGFPNVDAPGTIFNVAILRIQEILIGILSGSLVHGVVFPRTVTARIVETVRSIQTDAERWASASLSGASTNRWSPRQTRIMTELEELDMLSTHLPFDMARLPPSPRLVRAFQDQIALLLPVANAVGDRIEELKSSGADISGSIEGLLSATDAWLRQGTSARDAAEGAALLIGTTRALERTERAGSIWEEMLVLSLLSRLRTLVMALRDCAEVRGRIEQPTLRNVLPHLPASSRARKLHADRGLALRAALGTGATILMLCAFWIATAWPEGGAAVMMAAITGALFGNVEAPAPVAFRFLTGFVAGTALAMAYGFAILPRVTDFVMLCAVLAPALLILGSFAARPAHARIAQGALIAFGNNVGIGLTYAADFATFANQALAQMLGVAFATCTLWIFQTVDGREGIARIQRAAFADIGARAAGRREDVERWLGRMLDRIGLLESRVAVVSHLPDSFIMDFFRQMRVGHVAGELKQLVGESGGDERTTAEAALASIGRYYGQLDPDRMAAPPAALLDQIDRCVSAFDRQSAREHRHKGLVLLTSLRRNLFPDAPGYRDMARADGT